MLISDQSGPEVTMGAFVAAEKNRDQQTNVTLRDISKSIRKAPMFYTHWMVKLEQDNIS